MTAEPIVLVGRSSSHFTRTARIFALELGVAHDFRPVPDMATLDKAAYAGNPALKVPILIDEHGPLFGTENICRELARRSGKRDRVVLRGDVTDRRLANAEEMVLHAMSAEVVLITSDALDGRPGTPPPKVRASLENALSYLEAEIEAIDNALPAQRLLSFCEVALYCLVTHLPFRRVMEVNAYSRLEAFCRSFGARTAAQATTYRFDAAPLA